MTITSRSKMHISNSSTPLSGSGVIGTGSIKHTVMFGTKKTGKIREHRRRQGGDDKRNLDSNFKPGILSPDRAIPRCTSRCTSAPRDR